MGRDTKLAVEGAVLWTTGASLEEEATAGRLDVAGRVDVSARDGLDTADALEDEMLLVAVEPDDCVTGALIVVDGSTGLRDMRMGAAAAFSVGLTTGFEPSSDVSGRNTFATVLAGVRDVVAVLAEAAAVARAPELETFSTFSACSAFREVAGVLVILAFACGSGSDTLSTLLICFASFSSSDSGSTSTSTFFVVAVALVLLVGRLGPASGTVAFARVAVRGGMVVSSTSALAKV